MPLVTRTASQGNLFNQANEPSGWLNGDMWVDSDNANVAVNRSGTAQRIAPGTTVAGDTLFSNGANTMAALNIGTADQLLRTNSGATAPEWATIPSGLWTVLGDYEASIAEASHVFSFTAVDFDNDSALLLVVDGEVTATLALQLRLNTVATSTYFVDAVRTAAGAQTVIDLNGQAECQIGSTTLLVLQASFFGYCYMGLNKAGTIDDPSFLFQMNSANNVANEQGGGKLGDTQSDITDVEVLTSTSTWRIGTRFTLYKLARA